MCDESIEQDEGCDDDDDDDNGDLGKIMTVCKSLSDINCIVCSSLIQPHDFMSV